MFVIDRRGTSTPQRRGTPLSLPPPRGGRLSLPPPTQPPPPEPQMVKDRAEGEGEAAPAPAAEEDETSGQQPDRPAATQAKRFKRRNQAIYAAEDET